MNAESTDQTIAQIIESYSISSFNEEVIWDSNRKLFDLYFKADMYKKRYKFALVELHDKTEFDKGLNYLAKWS